MQSPDERSIATRWINIGRVCRVFRGIRGRGYNVRRRRARTGRDGPDSLQTVSGTQSRSTYNTIERDFLSPRSLSCDLGDPRSRESHVHARFQPLPRRRRGWPVLASVHIRPERRACIDARVQRLLCIGERDTSATRDSCYPRAIRAHANQAPRSRTGSRRPA